MASRKTAADARAVPADKKPRETYGSVATRARWLAGIIRRRIWGYLEGSRIPGERQLAERFGVSLRVARAALLMLQDEGVLQCARGQGSIVVSDQTASPPVQRIVMVLSGQPEVKVLEDAIAQTACRVAARRGLDVEIVNRLHLDIDAPEDIASRAAAVGAESGWLFVQFCPRSKVVDAWRLWRIPMVVVGGDAGAAIPSISGDSRNAIYEATQRLVLLGHRRIAYLSPPHSEADPTGRARWEGYTLAQQFYHNSVESELVWEDPSDNASDSRKFIVQRLARPDRPTAVVTATQALGLATLAACGLLGLTVPGQLSVISGGFDDDGTEPALQQKLARYSEGNVEQLAEMAIDVLVRYATSRGAARIVTGRCQWINGGSAGPFRVSPAARPEAARDEAAQPPQARSM